MNMYVTYLTTYSGNKLPPFYIGSTSLDKVNNGYHGSVKSARYKAIWKEELNNNPHLFKTVIVSKHNTRQEAFDRELILQTKLNVVKSPMYMNMALCNNNGYMFDISNERIKDGTHNFLKRKDGTSINTDRVNNGTHHLLRRSDGSSICQDRITNGTHNFIGCSNPSFDHNHYTFIHRDGTIYSGTRDRFIKEYGLCKVGVHRIIKGKCQYYKGWSLLEVHHD